MLNRILLLPLIVLICTSAQASPVPAKSNNSTAYPLLRLKLVRDAYDYDDIAIGFNAAATTSYNNQIDSRYMEGINAAEGLSSLSSDSVQLSVNIVPLPKQASLVIRLDIEAANSGPFTLERTELDSIPAVYEIWLVDKFAKDSLDLRTGTSYAFTVDKNNSATFGSNRFQVVIRQNPGLGMHLLSFDAIKSAAAAELNWKTANEQNSTVFATERSIDDGATFYVLDTLVSTGSGTYSYTDKTPINGTDLYRIKITDMNGTVSYSNAVSLDFSSTSTETNTSTNNISIYPNPSNGVINLAISQNSNNNSPGNPQKQVTTATTQSFAAVSSAGAASYDIKIFNINGTVLKQASSSSPSWQTNVSTLLPGTYIIQVLNNNDKTLIGKSTFIKL
jgi:hypothetical protein